MSDDWSGSGIYRVNVWGSYKYTDTYEIAKGWSHLPFAGSVEKREAAAPIIGDGGDQQNLSQSGSNSADLTQGGDSGNTADVNQVTGDTDARYGTSGATTTISPSTTINPQSEARGQSQANNQTNANAALQGEQHNEVVAAYEVVAPQQNIAVPVTVDLSDSADTSSADSFELGGSTVALLGLCAAGVAAVAMLRRKPNNRGARRRARRTTRRRAKP